jgi:butyryl-CoA dehydrogenase
MNDTAPHLDDTNGLSEEHQLLRETVRRFAEETLAPRAKAMDDAARLDPAVVTGLAELGLTSLTLAEQHGGAGMDAIALAITLEELARQDGATAWTLLTHLVSGAETLAAFGAEPACAAALPEIASGATLTTFAIAEAAAGSDLRGTRTVVRPHPDGFTLHGAKLPVTNANSRFMLVTACEGEGGPLSVFLVDATAGHVTVTRRIDTLGLRAADVGEVAFQGAMIPAAFRLGEAGDAVKVLTAIRPRARLGVAAIALGLAEGAAARARRYSQERITFGKPIAEHQAIALKLADARIQLATSRALVMRAASLATGAASPFAAAAAIAKVVCSEAAVRIAYDAIQIHGGYGYSAEYEVERYWRDAKFMTLAEGTNDLVRLELAK